MPRGKGTDLLIHEEALALSWPLGPIFSGHQCQTVGRVLWDLDGPRSGSLASPEILWYNETRMVVQPQAMRSQRLRFVDEWGRDGEKQWRKL